MTAQQRAQAIADTTDRGRLTEGDVTELLRARYAKPGNGGSGEYAFLPQVRNGAGFDADRTFDALVVDLYPSRGLAIHVIEIKVSRSDFLRELKEAHTKTAAALEVADRFWIAAPAGVVKSGELPDAWGLLEVGEDMKIRARHRAKPLSDHARHDPPPIPRGLVVGMLRSAPGAIPGRKRWPRYTNPERDVDA